jgi:DNA-directed RNA polymerase specialized sigma24 family protein
VEPDGPLGIHVVVSESATTVSENELSRAASVEFIAFYESEFAQAARFAWFLVRSSAAAEDLVREAFLALYQQYGHVENPSGFVHRAIVNRARTLHRDTRRKVVVLGIAGKPRFGSHSSGSSRSPPKFGPGHPNRHFPLLQRRQSRRRPELRRDFRGRFRPSGNPGPSN